MNVLILGGTSEARQLAGRLACRTDLKVTLSLAGRTAHPADQPVPVRLGGFGGVEGLAGYLARECIDALIDATHPYADAMAAHAAEATARTKVPILALKRPAWTTTGGDQWIEADGVTMAVAALGEAPRRVFLTIGRNEVSAFEGAPQHFYLIRSVDPIAPPLALPQAQYILARGPFSEDDERALLTQHRTEFIVAKNSGGSATYAKIAAARALSLTVVMLKRPSLPDVPTVGTVGEALAWLDHAPSPSAARGV
jgi:precorrin-6A/cobalt-precorrin-6A reductase